MAETFDTPFFEISCKNDINIDAAFLTLTRMIRERASQNVRTFLYLHNMREQANLQEKRGTRVRNTSTLKLGLFFPKFHLHINAATFFFRIQKHSFSSSPPSREYFLRSSSYTTVSERAPLFLSHENTVSLFITDIAGRTSSRRSKYEQVKLNGAITKKTAM